MEKDNCQVFFETKGRYEFSWEIKKFSSFRGILKSEVMDFEPVCSSMWKLVVCCEDDEAMRFGLQRFDRNTHVVQVKVHFVLRNSKGTPLLVQTMADVFTWADEIKYYSDCLVKPTPEIKNKYRLKKDDVLTIDGHITPSCCLERRRSGLEDLKQVQEDLISLLLDGEYTDVELCAEKESVMAHQFILSSRSLYFRNLLKASKDSMDSIDFETEKTELLAFLKCIYSGKLENLDLSQMLSCYGMAHQTELPDLQDICRDRLCSLMSEVNVCQILIAAHDLKDEMLTEKASCFLCRNFYSVPKDEWIKFVTSKSDIVSNIMIQIHSKDYLEQPFI